MESSKDRAGHRRPRRRGGFPTATKLRTSWITWVTCRRLPGRTTRTCCARSIVAAISKKGKLPKVESRNTYRSCESHVCLYLRPHLAHIRRDKLSVAHPD